MYKVKKLSELIDTTKEMNKRKSTKAKPMNIKPAEVSDSESSESKPTIYFRYLPIISTFRISYEFTLELFNKIS